MTKHIVITGATSGIGKALALDYAKLGYQVFACGRNQARLDALKQDNIHPMRFDITDAEAVKANCAALPPLDLVILNAGDCVYIDDAKHFDAKAFEYVINTNLTATGYLIEALACHIKPQGTLALIGSSVTFLPLPRAEAYGASKAGLAYLAQTLAIDLKPHQINVSLVSPGFVATPLTAKNDFEMPFLLSVEQASQRIIKGLTKGKSHISFPRRLTWLLKGLSLLPNSWWQHLAQKMTNKDQQPKEQIT